MPWQIPSGLWKGGDVWILGGGSSITKQFEIPDSVVEDVKNGKLPLSAYSPYMKAIHKKHVIGINVAYKIGSWIDIVAFCDKKFFQEHEKKLKEFKGVKAGITVSCKDVDWVKYVRRDHRRLGISDEPSMVSWNLNTGSAAIDLAVKLGAKRIFLLGFDMKRLEDKTHWHKEYGKGKPRRSPINHPPFAKHLQGFPAIAEDIKKYGVSIYNVSPESAIKEFPKITLKQALKL